MNILRMLDESEEEWLNEAVILMMAHDEPPETSQDPEYISELVERLLETLVHHQMVEYRVAPDGVESYRLTDIGRDHLTQERTRRETITPPPPSWVPANDC